MQARQIALFQQVVLAIMLIMFTWQTSFDFLQIPRNAFPTGLCIACALIYGSSLLSNPLKENGFSFLDITFFVWVLWHFMSVFWCERPFLVWETAFHWLALFTAYLTFKRVNLSYFNKRFWTWFFVSYLVFFLTSISWFYIQLSNLSTGFLFHIDDLLSTKDYLGINGNYVASILLMLTPIYILLFQWHMISKLFVSILFIIQLVCLVGFSAKAALMALIVAFLFYFFSNSKTIRRKTIISIFLGVSLILSLAIGLLRPNSFIKSLNPFRPILENTKDERAALWNKSTKLWWEKPVLGWGDGHWKIDHLKYGVKDHKRAYFSNSHFSHAHNLFMQTLSELGLVGLLLLMSFLITLWSNIIASKNKTILGFTFLAWFVLVNFYGLAYPNTFKLSSPLLLAIFGFANVKQKPLSQSSFISHAMLIFCLIISFIWSGYQVSNHILYNKIVQHERTKNFPAAVPLYAKLENSRFNRMLGPKPIAARKAKALWRSKHHDTAINSLTKALDINPYDWKSWYLLGNYYSELDQVQPAFSAYKKACSIHPNYFKANLAAADLAYQLNKMKEARQFLSFYEEQILPFRANHFSDEKFYVDNPNVLNYLKTLCSLEDQVLMLREKYEGNN